MTDHNLKLSGLVNLIMDKKLCLKKVIADLFDIQFTLPVLKLFSFKSCESWAIIAVYQLFIEHQILYLGDVAHPYVRGCCCEDERS